MAVKVRVSLIPGQSAQGKSPWYVPGKFNVGVDWVTGYLLSFDIKTRYEKMIPIKTTSAMIRFKTHWLVKLFLTFFLAGIHLY